MVCPRLEYASPVWSPHLAKDKELVEGVRKSALRVASKNWTDPWIIALKIALQCTVTE